MAIIGNIPNIFRHTHGVERCWWRPWWSWWPCWSWWSWRCGWTKQPPGVYARVVSMFKSIRSTTNYHLNKSQLITRMPITFEPGLRHWELMISCVPWYLQCARLSWHWSSCNRQLREVALPAHHHSAQQEAISLWFRRHKSAICFSSLI